MGQSAPLPARGHREKTAYPNERLPALIASGALEASLDTELTLARSKLMLCGNPRLVKDTRAGPSGQGLCICPIDPSGPDCDRELLVSQAVAALDPDTIDAVLPQTQCQRCGYPACRPYAEAIARGEADINRCHQVVRLALCSLPT